MSKVVIIGIDALDAILLNKFEADLPNLTQLRKGSAVSKLTSVQPPDSDTAWASIYTGLNPAKHGIVRFVDPLEKAVSMGSREADNSVLRGRTFWDLAGKAGKRVCLVFPHLGYPVWEVNGTALARSGANSTLQSSPPSVAQEYGRSKVVPPKGFPGRERHFPRYIQAHRNLLAHDSEFGLKMLRESDWELFFWYSSSLDMIQHYFWMYGDESDPSYPGPNPYKDIIRDFYRLYDDLVGRFLAAVDQRAVTIVISDHGHGMRPQKLVNFNEALRKRGWLASRSTGSGNGGLILGIERFKRNLAEFISRHRLGNLARLGLRLFPAGKRLYTSPLSIDWRRTLAHVSDLSGIKAYSYGGIRIIKENLGSADYEELRSAIIGEISQIRAPGSGAEVLDWACRREELYSGPYIDKYPDIVFNLRGGYGVGWAVHDSLFSVAASHNLVPGSHRADTPVFLMADPHGRQPSRREMTLMDVAPTVLDLLGVEGNFDFDGQSIFSPGVSSRSAQGAGSI